MTKIRAGSVVADISNFQMLVDDVALNVKPKVFDAFVMFCKAEGRVLTKQEIMDVLWADTYVTESSLFKLMQDLRNVLEQANVSDVTLETVPARGYKLIIHPPAAGDNKGCSENAKDDSDTTDQSTIAPTKTPVLKISYILTGLVIVGMLAGLFALLNGSDNKHPEASEAAGNAGPLNRQAFEKFARESPAEALEELRNMSLPENDWWRIYLTGTSLLKLGRVEESILELNRAANLQGLSYREQERSIDALVIALHHNGQLDDAINKLTLFLEQTDQPSLGLKHKLAVTLMDVGRVGEAEEILKGLVNQEALIQDSNLYLEVLNAMGSLFYHKGDREKSYQYFSDALAVAMDDANIMMGAILRNNMANLDQDAGRYNRAAKLYADAYRAMHQFASAQNQWNLMMNFANIYAEAREFNTAHFYYDKLIDWGNSRGFVGVQKQVMMNKALVYNREGKYQLAQELVEEFGESFASDEVTQVNAMLRAVSARALAKIGNPLLGLEQAQLAVEMAAKLQISEAVFFTKSAKGEVLFLLDDFEQALENLESAIKLSSSLYDRERLIALDYASLAAANLGQMEKALQFQTEATAMRDRLKIASDEFSFTLQNPLELPD